MSAPLPPPVKAQFSFQSPIAAEVEADNAARVKKLLDAARRDPPPDVVDAAMRKRLDSLSLLLRARFAPKSLVRMCPDLPMPREIVDGMDLSWIVNAKLTGDPRYNEIRKAVLQERERALAELAGTDGEAVLRALPADTPDDEGWQLVGDHCCLGRRSLTTIETHRGDPNVIDSPRSALVLLEAGLAVDQLRPSSDPLVERRRQKLIGSAQDSYRQLRTLLSMRAVVAEIRAYDPVEKREEALTRCSPAVSVRHESAAPNKHSHQRSPASCSGVSVAPMSPPRARPRHLERLQRHRDQLTAEWGLHQRTIAHHAYVNARVQKHVSEAREARRHRAATATPDRSRTPPDRESTIQHANSGRGIHRAASSLNRPYVDAVKGAEVGTVAEKKEKSEQRRMYGRAAGGRGGDSPRDLRQSAVLSRVDAVRRQFKAREAARVDQLLAGLEAKEAAAAAAKAQRAQEHHARLQRQRDRAQEVRDVKARMLRTADFKRLLLIKDLEEAALATDARTTKHREELSKLRQQQKERLTLEHRTKEFVESGASALGKRIFLQEAALSLDTGHQRVLKEESRTHLVRLLKAEDELISKWKGLESDTVPA